MLSKEELEVKRRDLIGKNASTRNKYDYRQGFDDCAEILWPEMERLRLEQYAIRCEAQNNKNLHETELFNSDNLLKRLNEEKAKVAGLERKLDVAKAGLKTISKTNISGDSVYDAAEFMKEEAIDTLKEIEGEK